MKHKFHAVRTEREGIKFPSKLEANYYSKLCLLKQSGHICFFLRQVPFDLPGKVRYIADFLIFFNDGTAEFVDVKGKDTPLSIAKRKMVEALYPIKINVVTKV